MALSDLAFWGYGVPACVVDAPGGGGKIRPFPDRLVRRDGDVVQVKNLERKAYRYSDPLPRG